jgi:pimeloyl-ACP methyl ester carboxylesterase
METGKSLHGAARLAFDAVENVTDIVEGMYRNIAAVPLPLGEAPQGRARGIAGLVHEVVRQVNRGVRSASDLILTPASDYFDKFYPPGPHRAAAIAALNGVCGDHLLKTANPLAIPMRMRVYLPRDKSQKSDVDGDQIEPKIAFANLFETSLRAVEVYPQPCAFAEADFSPSGRILILVHGLCMNDMEWTSQEHNHGRMLADAHGYTPVYAHYNSGRHISENGREFGEQISGLVDAWPVPVESVTIVGFSMGGLLTRSALCLAQQQQSSWLQKVDKVVYVGTPHHGSALERGGYWLQKSMTYSPYTAPLAALGRIRSAGITDLRHGNILDDDWQRHDEHEDNADHRSSVPLAEGIEHYSIGATLSKRDTKGMSRLLSDGLVHPDSSWGKHTKPEFNLQFLKENCRIFYDLGHLAMLHDQRVATQLNTWLQR